MPFIKSIEGKREVQVLAVLAGLMACAVIGGFFMKLINAEAFLGISTMCITYYFTKRNDDKVVTD